MRHKTRISPAVLAIAAAALLGAAGTVGWATESDPLRNSRPATLMPMEAQVAGGGSMAPPTHLPLNGSKAAAYGNEGSIGAGSVVSAARDGAVVRTASVSMRVENALEAAGEMRAIAAKFDADTLSENVSSGGGMVAVPMGAQAGEEFSRTLSQRVDFVFNVDPDDLTAFLDEIESLGDLAGRNASAIDVTLQVVGLDAQITSLTVSRDRLRNLIGTAADTDTILRVEAELANREAQLAGLTAQRDTVGRQVAAATVSVSLSETVEIPVVNGRSRLVTAIGSAMAALATTGIWVAAGLVYLLPVLAVLGGGWYVARRLRVRRAGATPRAGA